MAYSTKLYEIDLEQLRRFHGSMDVASLPLIQIKVAEQRLAVSKNVKLDLTIRNQFELLASKPANIPIRDRLHSIDTQKAGHQCGCPENRQDRWDEQPQCSSHLGNLCGWLCSPPQSLSSQLRRPVFQTLAT